MIEFNTPQELVDAVHQKLEQLHGEGTTLDFDFDVFMGRGGSHTLRPSSAGSCPRQLTYRALYPEEREDITARSVTVFLHGDIHHIIERTLISFVTPVKDIEKHVNFYVDDDIGFIPGAIDGQVVIEGKPYILDVKSASHFSFGDMERTGPREDHVAQLNCYMEATGIPRAIVWAVNKNTGHREAFTLEHDRKIVSEVRSRFREVWESIRSGGEWLPDRMYEAQDEIRRKKPTGRQYLPWQCNYCDFTERCWGEEGFEMVIERGKPRWIREAPDAEEDE